MSDKASRFRVGGYRLLFVLLFVSCTTVPESALPTSSATAQTTASAPSPTLELLETVLSPTSDPTQDMLTEPAPVVFTVPDAYGVTYAYPTAEWSERDRAAIRDQLTYLKGLGSNTVVQVFSSRWAGQDKAMDWLIFLDEAQRLNMHVIARLWPQITWGGNTFDLSPIRGFWTVTQRHPALLAVLVLHEPLEQFDSNQLQMLYTDIKAFAPDLKIAHFMGDMAWFEQSIRFANRNFTAGICDLCIIWYYPFRYLNGQPVFEREEVRKVLRDNRKLVDERAPESELWFLGQVYAMDTHRRQLRMPTSQEMEMLFTVVMSERVDGFLWYPWSHQSYDQVLSDTEMEPQRQAMRHIYDLYFSSEKRQSKWSYGRN